MPQMKSVFSSHISQVGYEDGQLHVIYKNGKSGYYEGVPEDVAANILNAPSIGSALHQSVRGQFDWKYHG